MGSFEETARKARTTLPSDLPNALEAVKAGRPAGAAYRSDNGKLYRLVHPGWRLDAREAKPETAKPEAKPTK